MYEVRVQLWDRTVETRTIRTEKALEGFVTRTSRSPHVAAIFVSKEGKRAKKVYSAKASENPNLKRK